VALAAAARMYGGRRDRRFAAAEQELWGAEETLRRAIAEREAADREAAERIASQAQAGALPPEPPAPPGDGAA
jgi:hypothetical protein